jgi:hypothetical protein
MNGFGSFLIETTRNVLRFLPSQVAIAYLLISLGDPMNRAHPMETLTRNAVMMVAILFFTQKLFTRVFPIRTSQPTTKFDDIIRKLARQTSRWAIAAEQDASPMIASLHAQYAAGYLWAIKDIATATEFERITGQSFYEFENRVTTIQDAVTKRLAVACPQYAKDIDRYLGAMAGDTPLG